MDLGTTANAVKLCGVIDSEVVYSHSLFGEAFHQFFLLAPRLSGTMDRLPVTVSERLLDRPLHCGTPLALTGQLRSYNKQVDGANRLILTVFAQSLEEGEGYENSITLCGYVCKPPIYRVTPFHREIADLLVAVNRAYNKSDYIPCIAWGRNARFAQTMDVGSRITLHGRIQSREYQKKLEDGSTQTRTAYEVSIGSFEPV